jgi:diketogulonate reductase-like aldo/keto reductase
MISTRTVTLSNGLQMPQIGFVVFKIPPGDKTYDAVRTALSSGYRAVDAAAVYGNEADVGRAIRDSGIDPGEIFVTTKVWTSDHGYANALRAFEETKTKLGLDTIDLYLIH